MPELCPECARFAGMNPLLESVMGPLLTVHQWLYENTDGRIGASLGGRPMLLLRTVGRRTREPRTAALLYVRDAKAALDGIDLSARQRRSLDLVADGVVDRYA